MKRSLLLIAALSFGCRTTQEANSGGTAKDIESVTRVQLLTPNNSMGQRIAVIKCADGFIDQTTRQTTFSVTYDTIRNLTQDQLEMLYCTMRVGSGNPGQGGGDFNEGDLTAGRYNKTDGDPQACAAFDLTVLRTPSGGIDRATIQCASGGTLMLSRCGFNSCTDPGNNRLSWVRGNVIILSLVNNGMSRDSTFVLSGNDIGNSGGRAQCPQYAQGEWCDNQSTYTTVWYVANSSSSSDYRQVKRSCEAVNGTISSMPGVGHWRLPTLAELQDSAPRMKQSNFNPTVLNQSYVYVWTATPANLDRNGYSSSKYIYEMDSGNALTASTSSQQTSQSNSAKTLCVRYVRRPSPITCSPCELNYDIDDWQTCYYRMYGSDVDGEFCKRTQDLNECNRLRSADPTCAGAR